jgi:hypothetical protein
MIESEDTCDIPDISLVEVAGFTFDLTYPSDRQLLELCLESLADADRLNREG